MKILYLIISFNECFALISLRSTPFGRLTFGSADFARYLKKNYIRSNCFSYLIFLGFVVFIKKKKTKRERYKREKINKYNMFFVKLFGGLGNQMFQVALGLVLLYEYNIDVFFTKYPKNKHGKNYNNSIFKNIKKKKNEPNFPIYYEKNFYYEKIELIREIDTKIIGYFQSEKYFKKYKEKITNFFLDYKEKINNLLDNEYNKIGNKYTISVHIRRGDYLLLKNKHPILEKEYYIKALKTIEELLKINIKEKYTIVIFSDDIKWCKENNFFKNYKYYFVKIDKNINNTELIELYLMSMCNHNIIANSTYSWWASYLNKNENKKIIAPKKWFCKNGPVKNDLYFENINYII